MHDAAAVADDVLAIDGMGAVALPPAGDAAAPLPLAGLLLRGLIGAVAVLVAIPALLLSMAVATLVIVISPLAALLRPN